MSVLGQNKVIDNIYDDVRVVNETLDFNEKQRAIKFKCLEIPSDGIAFVFLKR